MNILLMIYIAVNVIGLVICLVGLEGGYVFWSGIFNPKETHSIKTKVVDDTEYPIHNSIWTCLLLVLGVIFTPYITFLTLITRQIVSIIKN